MVSIENFASSSTEARIDTVATEVETRSWQHRFRHVAKSLLRHILYINPQKLMQALSAIATEIMPI